MRHFYHKHSCIRPCLFCNLYDKARFCQYLCVLDQDCLFAYAECNFIRFVYESEQADPIMNPPQTEVVHTR